MFLQWVALAASLAAPGLAARWLLRGVDHLGRRRPFPVISTVALTVLAAGAWVPVVRHHRAEERLSAVASHLVGHRVKVHCQTGSAELVDLGAELGYVRWGPDGRPEGSTLIKHKQCADLTSYSGSLHPSAAQVLAVHVLTHESMHMAGRTNEAEAECAAVQRDARTARLLGASPQAAVTLAQRYWREVYPRMREDYTTATCTAGGSLDEGLADAPWVEDSLRP